MSLFNTVSAHFTGKEITSKLANNKKDKSLKDTES